MKGAADDLDSLMAEMEERPGMMDRRFYVVCDEEDIQEVTAAMSRVGLKAGYLAGEALERLMLSEVCGIAPDDLPQQQRVHLRETTKFIKSDFGIYRKSLWVKKYPRVITAEFLQSILTLGIPMDVSIHIMPMAPEEAVSMLQGQLTNMQSAASQQVKRTGQIGSKEQIAMQDILGLRDAVMRGFERLFNTNMTITVSAQNEEVLSNHFTALKSIFNAVLSDVDELNAVQRKALATTMPLCENAIRRWTMLDTTTLALLFPFSPRDMDTRKGTFIGTDVKARTMVTFDPMNSPGALNKNVAVLATSGAGKTYGVKLLNILRPVMAGVRAYVVDPEGEYVDTCLAVGGRVLTPGKEGQGMNPFVVTDEGEDLNERIDSLCKLIQVMMGEDLNALDYGKLNHAMVTYYQAAAKTGAPGNWSGLYGHIEEVAPDIAAMILPFHSGSKRFLLSDEGTDLLKDEPPMTVFNLSMMDEEMSVAAGMVCAAVVWALATKDPRDRVLVVDEVWRILQIPEGAGFMLNTAKRARKHKLGLVSITQDVQDLLAVNSSEGVRGNSGRALITNSNLKILLRQDPASIPLIEETFNLPHEEAVQLSSYPRGRGLLITPEGHYSIDIEAAVKEAAIIEFDPFAAANR